MHTAGGKEYLSNLTVMNPGSHNGNSILTTRYIDTIMASCYKSDQPLFDWI